MQPTYQEQWSNIDGMADPQTYVAIMSQIREAQPDDHFAQLLHLLDLKPGLQILEVCCGQGRVAQFVAQQDGVGHVEGFLDLSYDEEIAKDPAFDYALTRLVFLEPLIADAQMAGIASAAEAEQWLAEQDQRARDRRFYLSIPAYRVIATKPKGV